ncbi:Na/Pi symporter [Fulvivirgaceae bacterium BMA10]|uniref:Na/Pi symporter n=1 Tax=Splendidivirga corallicola TaxID=3051826 RepID=A0ABT8KW89_9BACT|nr:Na/Pi symporter [Fulvivirgaceae bacterium BMA10]
MTDYLDIWKLLAGLGIFLFGMFQLEESIREVAGRKFKLFLRRHTHNKYRAILSGTFLTAVLQSSSVVSLMLLAFVGAGAISMTNALGVILGSNLGTTFTGWIVTLLGFKIKIESFSLPFIAIGGLGLVLFSKKHKLLNISKALVGFGFIFLGLDFMKVSIDEVASYFDISSFSGYAPWVFLLVGFVLTAIIQSSSASMVITLSALNSGIIPFESAAAMVIGSDLGTTITVLIGGITGLAPKRRVALGHFLFNLVTDLIAFALLVPLVWLIQEMLTFLDPLMGLVVFHSLFNLIGIIIFVPFLGVFAKFLKRRYRETNHTVSQYINPLTHEVPEAATQALMNEIGHLLRRTYYCHLKAFKIKESEFYLVVKEEFDNHFKKIFTGLSFNDQYLKIKQLEGELIVFYQHIQQQPLEIMEADKLSKLVEIVRNALHSIKGIKDIEHNLTAFYTSEKNVLNKLYHEFENASKEFYLSFKNCLETGEVDHAFDCYSDLMLKIQRNYDGMLKEAYSRINRKHFTELEMSTALNINRELYSSHKALIIAQKEFHQLLIDSQ